MSVKEEFFNMMLPMGNTPATRSIVAVEVNPTGGVLNLDTVFAPTGGDGHYYEIKADGVPTGTSVLVAMSPSPTYTIRQGNVSVGAAAGGVTGVAWPLLNGQSVVGRLPQIGVEVSPTLAGYSTGGYKATLMPAPYMHFRGTHLMPTGAVLRIRRMTLVAGEKASDKSGWLASY